MHIVRVARRCCPGGASLYGYQCNVKVSKMLPLLLVLLMLVSRIL